MRRETNIKVYWLQHNTPEKDVMFWFEVYAFIV